MMLAVSSPMIPADSLTAKAELLKRWGYDALGVFQPLEDWNDGVRRELMSLEKQYVILTQADSRLLHDWSASVTT